MDRLPGLAGRLEALDVRAHPLAGLLRPAYAVLLKDTGLARRYIEENLATQDEWLIAVTWLMSAGLAGNDGDMGALRPAADQALKRFRALGERWGLSTALRLTGEIKMMDGDLDGAAAAFTEASRVLAELGSRDDQAQVRLHLADVAARRGDVGTARDLFEQALALAESDGSSMEVSLVAAAIARYEITAGNAGQARARYEAAEQGIARLSGTHPARHHLIAHVAAAGLMIAVADGDLALARDRAAHAYQAAAAAQDMPHLSSAGACLAFLAQALGRAERAAEMLGACEVVRGGEDKTDPLRTMLATRLRASLGPDGYARAYERGKALGRAGALTLLDPAGL